MKKMIALCCLLLAAPAPAAQAAEKIDPVNYICAELLVQPATDGGQPPIFEALQIDGYASAAAGHTVADPTSLATMLTQVYGMCQARPADTVLKVWQEARKALPPISEGEWSADATTCKDYVDNEDNGSGFLIWLDGYNRQKSGNNASVLANDESIKSFIEACTKAPGDLMLDVMKKNAK